MSTYEAASPKPSEFIDNLAGASEAASSQDLEIVALSLGFGSAKELFPFIVNSFCWNYFVENGGRDSVIEKVEADRILEQTEEEFDDIEATLEILGT